MIAGWSASPKVRKMGASLTRASKGADANLPRRTAPIESSQVSSPLAAVENPFVTDREWRTSGEVVVN
jgi:hypothetical protein